MFYFSGMLPVAEEQAEEFKEDADFHERLGHLAGRLANSPDFSDADPPVTYVPLSALGYGCETCGPIHKRSVQTLNAKLNQRTRQNRLYLNSRDKCKGLIAGDTIR